MRINKIVNSEIKNFLKENFETEYRTQNDDGTVELNNFDIIKKLLKFNKNQDTYYVEIIKRKKDNPTANFHYRQFLGYYLIHSVGDLDAVEDEIKNICKTQNARAYIYMNARESNIANKTIEKIKKEFNFTKKLFGKYDRNQSRYGHELEIAYGRSLDIFSRPICLVDVDSPTKAIHDAVHRMFQNNGISIYMEYETLNGGLHIFTPDKEKLKKISPQFVRFNTEGGRQKGRDYGLYNIVGMDIDKPAILYVNLTPQGYKPL